MLASQFSKLSETKQIFTAGRACVGWPRGSLMTAPVVLFYGVLNKEKLNIKLNINNTILTNVLDTCLACSTQIQRTQSGENS